MYDLKQAISFRIQYAERADMIEALKTSRIDTVDIDLCSTFNEPLAVQERELARLEDRLDILRQNGIGFNAVHVSFGALWALEDDEEENRLRAVERTLDVCKRTAKYGIKIAIVHTNGLDFSPNKDRQYAISQLRKSLTHLSKYAPQTIAVENLPRNCLGNTADELLQIIEGIAVKIVVDVNHFLQEKPQDAICKFGDRIVTTHISDCDGIDEKHWLPGLGSIEWEEIIAALERVGYNSAFTYETRLLEPLDIIHAANNKKQLFRIYNKLNGNWKI